MMINNQAMVNELLASRQISGTDRFDEVWEGVYTIFPAPNNEHQELASELTAVLRTVVDWQHLGHTLAGANVSDRQENWTHNYRVPDVLVFLADTLAIDCVTHWCGGPDLVVEIVSPDDRTLDKLDFYASIRTRELLVIDRDPWQLTLYRLSGEGKLSPVALSNFSHPSTITLESIPIALRIASESSTIELTDAAGKPIRSIPIPKPK